MHCWGRYWTYCTLNQPLQKRCISRVSTENSIHHVDDLLRFKHGFTHCCHQAQMSLFLILIQLAGFLRKAVNWLTDSSWMGALLFWNKSTTSRELATRSAFSLVRSRVLNSHKDSWPSCCTTRRVLGGSLADVSCPSRAPFQSASLSEWITVGSQRR